MGMYNTKFWSCWLYVCRFDECRLCRHGAWRRGLNAMEVEGCGCGARG